MSQSTNLRLPYLAANQAQKHVTVNEAFRFLDALVQLSIKSAALSAPPGSPADGNRYIVAAAPTGAWAGHATHVAAWQDGAWAFYAPGEGWVAWNEATSAPLVYKAGAWVSLFGGTFAGGSITELGINAATDATNKFVFFGTNMLFNTGGSIDATFNKAAAGNDASFSFKTGFSARALLGLLGSDDFTIKVSANGSTFFTGLVVDRSSGRVSLPQGMALGGLAADPGSPQNGWLWHNSTTGQLKARLDGITRILAPDEIPFVAPGAGDYVLTTIGAGAATGTLAGVADRVDLFPFVPRADLSIDRLSRQRHHRRRLGAGQDRALRQQRLGPAGRASHRDRDAGFLDHRREGGDGRADLPQGRHLLARHPPQLDRDALGLGGERHARSDGHRAHHPAAQGAAPDGDLRDRRAEPLDLRLLGNRERRRHRDLAAVGMSEREVAGYVAELKAQIAFLSERAALLAAQLADKTQEAELLRARIRAHEIAPGAEAAPEPAPNGGETP